MTLKLCSIAAALALAFGMTAAQAQQSRDPGTRADRPAADRPAADRSSARKVKDAEEDKIEADAKAAKAKCETMQGNAKDVCQAEAKAQEKIAKAELDAKKNPTARNQRKAAEMKAEGAYEVAKEKCDDLKGNEKDACQKDAKAKQDQAKADIKKQFAQRKDDRPARAATGATTERRTERPTK
ncbi:MAG: hypothetical protein A3G81_10340 [Betaproteobacteria bacterium RIFCSPLOWO2_12_FULL_65_14]|nr:MAG: hypothetical protein A3G81_10340 [Betaproteobacteria bacterium RIFCSPLOWO2_12_FULL_65_14]